MRWLAVARMVGLIALLVAPVAAVPGVIDGLYGAPIRPWIETTALFVVTGLALHVFGRRGGAQIGPLEGAAITAGAWLVVGLIGGWGLYRSFPGATLIEGVFEVVSALTTTGASAFGESGMERIDFAHFTHGALLWRGLCSALGGVGVVVMTVALLPLIGSSGFQLFRSEVSGLATDRVTPRLADTARLIAAMNLTLTMAITVGFRLCGVPWFDAVVHALAAINTAGFSSFANSADGLPPAAQWLTIAGMLVGGLNLTLIIAAVRGTPLAIWRSEEARAYLLIMALLCIGVVTVLLIHNHPYGSAWPTAIRHGIFAVVSLATTTGFTVGYAANPASWSSWHPAAVLLLMVATLGLGCAGSTAGGIKTLRVVLTAKLTWRALRQFREPALIAPITLDGRTLPDRIVLAACVVLALFAGSWVIGTFVLLVCAPLDLLSAITACLTCLTNVGPGLGQVGPEHSFTAVGQLGLVICTLLMLIGRLEFLAVLAVGVSLFRR